MKIMQSFIHNYMSTVNVLKHTQNIKAIGCTGSNSDRVVPSNSI